MPSPPREAPATGWLAGGRLLWLLLPAVADRLVIEQFARGHQAPLTPAPSSRIGGHSMRHVDHRLDEVTFRFNRRRSGNRGQLSSRLLEQPWR